MLCGAGLPLCGGMKWNPDLAKLSYGAQGCIHGAKVYICRFHKVLEF